MVDNRQPLLLTDEQVSAFIRDGFLILRTDFPKSFHDRLLAQLNEVYENEGNPGNNILPRIKELQKIFDHPVVTGALTSVLGPNYLLHTHRHGHFNAVDKPGAWHKDSYWGYHRMRNHHPHWAMIMYFPQDTPPELGPTGILPGTQNYETRTFADENPAGEALASGEAGTFALIHYDIWHRSTANLLGNPRYMLKFEFMRTTMPTAPSWDNRSPEWRGSTDARPTIHRHDIMWEETWNWMSGRTGSLADTRPVDEPAAARLTAQLAGDDEPAALDAAYGLACGGRVGVEALLQALRHEDAGVVRLAGYGLAAAGEQALSGLTEALADERPESVISAAFALAELGRAAAPSLPRIAALSGHPSKRVRRVVAEAMGAIGEPAGEAADCLIRLLRDEEEQVRFTAALALIRLGPAAAAAVPHLQAALDDDNRYVRGHALEALRYIGTEEAQRVLLKELFNNRWCYSTSPASTF